MNNATIRSLAELAKCLEDASLCTEKMSRHHDGLLDLAPQLLSLKLILDNNVEAL